MTIRNVTTTLNLGDGICLGHDNVPGPVEAPRASGRRPASGENVVSEHELAQRADYWPRCRRGRDRRPLSNSLRWGQRPRSGIDIETRTMRNVEIHQRGARTSTGASIIGRGRGTPTLTSTRIAALTGGERWGGQVVVKPRPPTIQVYTSGTELWGIQTGATGSKCACRMSDQPSPGS